MSETVECPLANFDDLQLQLKVRSGEFCAARAGATLVLYYAKPMRELSAVVGALLDRYFSFIPEGAIQSTLSATGVWRPFTKQALTASLRKLGAQETEYRSIHLSSGAPANVGDYGFHFFGSNLSNADIKPRETCACIMEFPAAALEAQARSRFVEFAAAVAEVEPFESGHGGYAFKHLSETWRDQALPWIAQQAQRYRAFDISYDGFKRVARGRVVNVSWLTLLGQALVEQLGGGQGIASQLPTEVVCRAIKTGVMLVAGDSAPVGDTNRPSDDIRWLKAVAALTKPVRASMEIGFGGDRFRHGWLDRFDQG